MHAGWKAFPFALLVALGGCDRDEPAPRPAEPAPLASVARALGIDAGELEPSVDPPAPVGDLKAELEAFTTVDACVQAKAAGDPAVGDALESIGYDTLVRDACRMLDAAKNKDAKRCSEILASSLKTRCEGVVAELAGSPEACPFESVNHPEQGRDASCLALASHDLSLCAGALDHVGRATCEALGAHDAAPCKKLAMRADQERCARDERRWSAVLPAAETDARAGLVASGKAEVTGDAGALASGGFPVDVSRGVVVLERLDGARLTVGPMARAGLGFIAASPAAPKTLAVELVVPPELKKAHVERVQLDVPGHPPYSLEGSQAGSFVVHVARFEKRRGGAVELTVDGHVEEGVSVHAEVTTFVRDVVTASAILKAEQVGDPAGMR